MKSLLNILIPILLLTFSNCNSDDNLNLEYTDLKTIEIGDYQLEVPNHFELKPGQGIDSYVGNVNGSGITLAFDFGVYTSPYENIDTAKFDLIFEVFDSVERQIVLGKNPQEDFTAIHIRDLNNFSELGNYVSLHMRAYELSAEQQALAINILKSTVLID